MTKPFTEVFTSIEYTDIIFKFYKSYLESRRIQKI